MNRFQSSPSSSFQWWGKKRFLCNFPAFHLPIPTISPPPPPPTVPTTHPTTYSALKNNNVHLVLRNLLLLPPPFPPPPQQQQLLHLPPGRRRRRRYQSRITTSSVPRPADDDGDREDGKSGTLTGGGDIRTENILGPQDFFFKTPSIVFSSPPINPEPKSYLWTKAAQLNSC